MNSRTLIGLCVAALLALVAAIALNHVQKPVSDGGATSAYLAPTLRDHLNDISKIVVTGADNKTIATLVRGANGWGMVEKDGYPVDTGKLREFLLKLADAKLVEQKTENKDKYPTLGVEDVAGKDAKGVLVQIDGLAQPLQLIVGNTNPRGGGTFVRRAGEAQSWLASGTFSVEKNPVDWLKKDLVDIAADRIQMVTIDHPDGTHVRVAKNAPGDANFTLDPIPKGREPGAEYSINGLASTLAALRFDDVVPAKDAPPDDKALKARYAMFDGLVIDATVWEKDAKDYAKFAASLDTTQAEKDIAAAQAKAKADFESASIAKSGETKDAKATDAPIKPLVVSDPVKDRENRLVGLNKEVADLNARFSGWTFVLPAYKYASINKTIEDLLKPPQASKQAQSAKATAGRKPPGSGK